MNRIEIAAWWYGGMAFVLISTWLILKGVEIIKPIVKGVCPRIEVYKKKKHLKHRRKKFITDLFYRIFHPGSRSRYE